VLEHRFFHLLRLTSGIAFRGSDVDDEMLLISLVFLNHHRCLPYPLSLRAHSLHFFELDAEAAKLDLGVGASQVFQIAAFRPPH